MKSIEHKNRDGRGPRIDAEKASAVLPRSSRTTSSAKGRTSSADKSRSTLPDALPTNPEGRRHRADDKASWILPSGSDGEGRAVHADKARKTLPSPSPRKRRAGLGVVADKASMVMPESASGEEGRSMRADKAEPAVPTSPLLDQLAELQVRRKFYIGAVNKQTNAVKALVRRAMGWRYDAEEDDREKMNKRAGKIVAKALAGKPQDPEDAEAFGAIAADLAVVSSALVPLQDARNDVEKKMKQAARSLPITEWAKGVHGFGELGLAVIIAEAGDLAKYPKKGHLWKRLGLAVHEGRAYSTWRMKGGLTAEQWTEAGYSPRRRAEVYAVISDPLFRAQSVAAGPYRAIYDRRRAATAITHEDWTKGHSHMDALRVMTKYMIRDLWVAWRRVVAEVPIEAMPRLPAAELTNREAVHEVSHQAADGRLPTGRKGRRSVADYVPNAAIGKAPTANPT